jgi:hypothetical protein
VAVVVVDMAVAEVVSTGEVAVAFTVEAASMAVADFTAGPQLSTAEAVGRCFTVAAFVPAVPYSTAAGYAPVRSSTAAAIAMVAPGSSATGSRTTVAFTGVSSTERPTIRMMTTPIIIRIAGAG